MMNLVLIHGRAQQGKDKDELVASWIATLKKGLAKNGLTLPENINVIFPFYGDLLDELVTEVENPAAKSQAKGEAIPGLQAFEFDLYSEMAANAGISELEISEELPQEKGSPTVQEKGPLNWEWVQAILKVLSHGPMGDFSVKKFTRDVYTYLHYDYVRKKVNKFIIDQLNDGPTVVVAHSLGSVVAYDILRTVKTPVVEFITVGSPLGLKAIKKKLVTPLTFPEHIEGDWYNAFDKGDYVALHPLDEKNFNLDPAVKNYDKVNNHTSNQHGISGYLDDQQVAKWIYAALLKI